MSTPEQSALSANSIVAFIGDIFARCGDAEYLGEPVTMAEHMLQSATLAEQQGCDDEMVVSALLHDIGHFTSEFGTFSMEDTADRFHEEAGAKVLERFFPTLVTDCVRFHVAAKRYLCATRPEYLDRLSSASVHSLNLQGGPMNDTEVSAFEGNPNLDNIVQVRLFDDAAKDPALKTPDYAHFAPRVQRVVDRHCHHPAS